MIISTFLAIRSFRKPEKKGRSVKATHAA
jgi:hypothetical protein